MEDISAKMEILDFVGDLEAYASLDRLIKCEKIFAYKKAKDLHCVSRVETRLSGYAIHWQNGWNQNREYYRLVEDGA